MQSSNTRQSLSLVVHDYTSSRSIEAIGSRVESIRRLLLAPFQQQLDNLDILGSSKGVFQLLFRCET